MTTTTVIVRMMMIIQWIYIYIKARGTGGGGEVDFVFRGLQGGFRTKKTYTATIDTAKTADSILHA